MPLLHSPHTEPSFGLELASVFDCHAQKAPTAVLKCIEAVESRGEGVMCVYSIVSEFCTGYSFGEGISLRAIFSC